MFQLVHLLAFGCNMLLVSFFHSSKVKVIKKIFFSWVGSNEREHIANVA